jgi:hypothetical protein
MIDEVVIILGLHQFDLVCSCIKSRRASWHWKIGATKGVQKWSSMLLACYLLD